MNDKKPHESSLGNEDKKKSSSFSISVDVKSGRFLGKQNGSDIDELTTDINANIFKAIQSISLKEKECADQLNDLITASKHKEAADFLLDATVGAALWSAPGKNILIAAKKINLQNLDEHKRIEVQKTIAGLASKTNNYSLAYPEIKSLLEQSEKLEKKWQHSLKNALALAELEKGAPETALKIWEKLLHEADDIDAGERAWIYRNMGFVFQDRQDEKSTKHAEQCFISSIDAFLESGDKINSAKNFGYISKLYENKSLEMVLEKYDEMFKLIDQKGIYDDEVKANIYHAKARKLFDARIYKESLDCALNAVDLRRGVYGAEDGLLSSLSSAKMAAENINDFDTVNDCENEISLLNSKQSSEDFDARNRAMSLLDSFDEAEAETLIQEAENSDDINFLSGVKTAVILKNPKFDKFQKLAEFERLHADLLRRGAEGETLSPVRLSIAGLLREQDDLGGACRWYRKVIDSQPLDLTTHELLLKTLWQMESWGDAVILLAHVIEKFGAAPGFYYAYGKSMFEAGDMSGAVAALTHSIELLVDDDNLEKLAKELREEAFKLGGNILEEKKVIASNPIVTLEDVQIALDDFKNFISNSKRMKFWEKKKKQDKYTWISRPEAFGQTLLHTFLKARFKDQINVFEEIDVGAGRLDILAQFQGGLSVIIELKMCGLNYSSTYAKEGEGQIKHYMDNHNIYTGYLVVFDSRIRDYGKTLIGKDTSRYSIDELLIDMRPTIKK